jgi:hypothetical protein
MVEERKSTSKEMRAGVWLSICWAAVVAIAVQSPSGKLEDVDSINDLFSWAARNLVDGWKVLVGGLALLWAWALSRASTLGKWAAIATAVWVGIVVLLTILPLSEARGIRRPLLAWQPRYVFEGDAWTVLMVGVAMIWAIAVGAAWIRTGK